MTQPNPNIRTRIAPSPTGKMHIGTARTALFNKLFALHHGGTYCVRIEDTDKERSTPENYAFIKEALTWLGLEPDEEYVLQSEAVESHKAAAQKLLDEGKAYKDDGAVRFKIPEGTTTWKDAIQGEISYKNEQLEDFVILRSDGSPTYHLGVVVDDAAMEITHVIRGDDHINNTPKQILLHQALGNTVPVFAHAPLIHGTDGKKLSKRHGAMSVQDYRDAGYLPAGVNHMLMQLSWLPGDEMDPITLEEASAKFDLAHVKKGAAVLDPKKMDAINNSYIKQMPVPELLALMQLYMDEITPTVEGRLLKGLAPLQARSKTLLELIESCAFYAKELPFDLDDTCATELVNGQAHVKALTGTLANTEWDHDPLHNAIANYIESNGLKFPMVGKPLRIALIGQTQGPGLADILLALGKEESLKRLKAATRI